MTYSTFTVAAINLALLPLNKLAKEYYNLPNPPWRQLEIFNIIIPANYVEWMMSATSLGVAALMTLLFRLDRISAALAILLIVIVCAFAVGSIVYFEPSSRLLVTYTQSTSVAVLIFTISLFLQFFLIRCLWMLVMVVRNEQQNYVAESQPRGFPRAFRLFLLPVYFSRLPHLRKIVVAVFSLLTIYFFARTVAGWTNLPMGAAVQTESTIVGAVNGCLHSAQSPTTSSSCMQVNDLLRSNIIITLLAINLAGPLFFLALARLCRLIQELASRTNIEVATKRDDRAPVVYLRPFGMETEKVKGTRRDPLDWLFDVTDRKQRLDQIVLDEMTAVGPVIGLGNPRDTWQPTGIAREYAPDGAWKDRIASIISRAKRIVLTIADTPHMLFEIEEIARLQRAGDTLFLLPPGLPPGKAEEMISSIQQKLGGVAAPPIHATDEGASPLAFWFTGPGDAFLCVSKSFSSDAYRASIRAFENLRTSAAVHQ